MFGKKNVLNPQQQRSNKLTPKLKGSDKKLEQESIA